jgi:hypothetical protein
MNNKNWLQGTPLVRAPAGSTTGFKEDSEENIKLKDFWNWADQNKVKPGFLIL